MGILKRCVLKYSGPAGFTGIGTNSGLLDSIWVGKTTLKGFGSKRSFMALKCFSVFFMAASNVARFSTKGRSAGFFLVELLFLRVPSFVVSKGRAGQRHSFGAMP
jgi:hypothetical protein